MATTLPLNALIANLKRFNKIFFLIFCDFPAVIFLCMFKLKAFVYNFLCLIEKNETQFPTFTFQDFISQFYPHKTLEYLLMDIEGVEVALMKELIGKSKITPFFLYINLQIIQRNIQQFVK